MKKTFIATALLAVFACCFFTACQNLDTPPSISSIQGIFDDNYNDIRTAATFMTNSGYEDVCISDINGTMFADFSHVSINDDDAFEAIKQLIKDEGFIQICKIGNTIWFQQWDGIRDISCGIAFSINGIDDPEVQYTTELLPLDENGWFYYVADYELWRTMDQWNDFGDSRTATASSTEISYTYQVQTIKDSTSYPDSIIEYPQLSNGNNDYSKANQSIRDAIITQIDIITDSKSIKAVFNLTYSITFSKNKLLCILFEGVISAEQAPHPTNFAFSIYMSVETGEQINPITLFELSPELLTEFREQLPNQNIYNTRFDAEQWESIVSYIASFSDDDLIQMICSDSDTTIALQEDGVLILFPVPRAAGDYVKIRVPTDWYEQ